MSTSSSQSRIKGWIVGVIAAWIGLTLLSIVLVMAWIKNNSGQPVAGKSTKTPSTHNDSPVQLGGRQPAYTPGGTTTPKPAAGPKVDVESPEWKKLRKKYPETRYRLLAYDIRDRSWMVCEKADNNNFMWAPFSLGLSFKDVNDAEKTASGLLQSYILAIAIVDLFSKPSPVIVKWVYEYAGKLRTSTRIPSTDEDFIDSLNEYFYRLQEWAIKTAE